MTFLALLTLQTWAGASWGSPEAVWQFYGAKLHKSSALEAPRAFVAVLNGATEAELPYQSESPRAKGWTDSLLSSCLNTEAATTLYIHFAYQRGGLMDPPESDDTLRLWGLRADGAWQILWDTVGTGQADTLFHTRLIALEESLWRHPCFRLRWAVYGSTYGAYDNWLLAYSAVSANNRIEGAFWQSLPRTYWGKYGIVPPFLARRWRDSLITILRGPQGLSVLLTQERPDGVRTRTHTLSGQQDTVRWPSLQGPFPQELQQMEVVYSLTPTPEVWTDRTAVGPWLGYDDGEMEQGYGLSVASRAFLQVFELDTLVAVNRMAIRFFPVPTQTGKPFQLGVWLLDEKTEPLYLRFHRIALDSMAGGFVEYPLDTLLWVRGRVGVGFIQADNQPLGVGWDASYRGSAVVFRDSAGSWVPSRRSGCLMLRLGLVPQELLALPRENEAPPLWLALPVPVRASMPVQIQGRFPEGLTLWDVRGCLLQSITESPFLAPAQAGVYLLRDGRGRLQKLLVLP